MSVVIAFLIGYLWANATLDKSGHLMFVEYSINEPTKDEGVNYSMSLDSCNKTPFIGDFNFLEGGVR